ncbi:MAG TPA: CoB--CoM heterodisulfide reductase iron-sulfur subunit B family protein [Verrucomicrobiae bacterium]|nr:CoB--CoM heterodisulfide reductase iron-sulfur subunit B family protein [Verrucomicrobiae bacterium]
MSAYSYFPGCSLRGTGAAYEESLLALFHVLGLSLTELEDWNCCGATSYMSIDEGSAFLLSARNLALAHKAKCRDVVAPCSACYLVLRKTQDYAVRYPAIGAHVGKSLAAANLPALDGVRVRHPLEVLYNDVGADRIHQLVKRPWRGGPVACYYGCQIVRPYHEVDRDCNPTRMDELLNAAGVPTVEYALKTKCCGGSLTGTMHEIGVRLNYVLLKEAVRKRAQAIVTVCPLCQYNLDACQAEIRRGTGERYDLPILYFTQALGWVLGADPEALGFSRSISGQKSIRQWFSTATEEAKAYV